MRTHADIIRDAGGPVAVHARLGLHKKLRTVRSWKVRSSIPSEYWRPLADLGLATVDELATARASRQALMGQKAA